MSKPNTRWLKSGRVNFAETERTDDENGILYGVIMCQVGEAKGHDVHLEQEFIDAGIAYAQKYHGDKGMKARFGHPGMSNETLGTEMGRFKNFRVVDDKMVADLHLYKSANLSPTQPGMRDWMLSMAEEDPEAIMCSIVFTVDHYYQYDGDGKKIKIWYYTEDGDWVTANSQMKVYVALKELMFCDIVDQGAATDKLFSEDLNSDKFAVIATQFFNEYPQIEEFIQEHPEKIFDFLSQRFGIDKKPEPGLLDKFISLFSSKQSNSIQFNMGKVQLSKLSALADKLANSEAGPDDYAAVQTELQEQGVNVVVLGAAQHDTMVKRNKLLSEALAASVTVLSLGETPAEEVNLSEAITAALSERDNQIADLQKQLGEKDETISDLQKQLGETSDDPPSADPKGQQQFNDAPDHPVSQDEKEFQQYSKMAEEASQIFNS